LAGDRDREQRTPRQRDESEQRTPDRPPRGLLVGALLLGLLLILAFASRDDLDGSFGQRPLELGEFEELLERNEVEEVRFKELQAVVTLRPGDLRAEREGRHWTINFVSPEVVESEIALIRELRRKDQPNPITTRVIQEPSRALLYQLMLWFLPTLFLVGLLYFLLFRQMRGPGSPGSLINFGKSKHRLASDKADITLKDVAGIDEARQDIEEIIAFLENPQKFSRLGGRIPKGVLLVGPPGTGKTLLAKATAGEAGVPFFSVSGSDFVEMFVGVGASRVRDLFEKAKEDSPCIIFLDEVDAVGRRRGSGLGGGHDEREQTLNQILVEMDGFDTDKGIIVMAATNRSDILDPALLRPGRFDRQIHVPLPDVRGRESILRVHAKNKKLALDVDLATIAKATATFSGAELEAMLNEAALMAAMVDHDSITMADLEEARDKVRWGRQRKSQKVVEEELRATAFHEGGHALVAALVDGCDPLHKVTVVPRGQALGLTMALPENDVRTLTKRQLEARIAMAYGGRIGEAYYTHDLSTGAHNDIQQATDLARRMVTEWGMSDVLGPLRYSTQGGDEAVFLGRDITKQKSFSDETLNRIDAEIRRITTEQYERAERVIEEHRDALGRVAEGLLRYETLTGQEVADLIAGRELTRSLLGRNGDGAAPSNTPVSAIGVADPDDGPASGDDGDGDGAERPDAADEAAAASEGEGEEGDAEASAAARGSGGSGGDDAAGQPL